MNVFTLVSDDYAYGLAALCNSLCSAGFDGQVHVGHKGELRCEIAASAPIVLHELVDDALHPMNRKPAFLLDHAFGLFLYLDSDIIVMDGTILTALSDAVRIGPVFCAEGIVPERDIRRAVWRRAKADSLGEAAGLDGKIVRSTNIYFNSGLVCGDAERDRRLVSDWNRIIRRTLPADRDGLFEVPYFPMPDQDCLNALLQDEQSVFSCISPPDVWYATSATSPFSHVGNFAGAILHGTGPKPWQLKSVPLRNPNPYENSWYRFLSQDTPWVRCRIDLPKAVWSWLGNGRCGRLISRAKRLRARLAL